MSFRFRRSVRIAPGVRLNLSRSGVSTTVGVRGLSVNLGRRGAYLNAGLPGTGISSRTRIGGGGGGGAVAAGATEAAGCAGCGGAGILLLLFAGFCSAILSGPHDHSSPGLSTGSSYTSDASPAQTEALYVHRPLNLRDGPGSTYAVVRTLARGERIDVGPADARGWAPAYDGYGSRAGYVYRRGDRLGAYPPSEGRTRRRSHPGAAESRSFGASAVCRDGTYSYSAHRRGTCSHHGGVAQWL